jgi:hypothetical protein
MCTAYITGFLEMRVGLAHPSPAIDTPARARPFGAGDGSPHPQEEASA